MARQHLTDMARTHDEAHKMTASKKLQKHKLKFLPIIIPARKFFGEEIRAEALPEKG